MSPDAGGCDFVLDPNLPAPRDRPIWRAEAHPFVVLIGASPHGFAREALIDPDMLRDVSLRFADEDGLHVVIGAGRNILRLRFEPGLQEPGAVLLPPEPCERARMQVSLWFLRWLRGRTRDPSPEAARLTDFRRERLGTLLRLLDYLRAGASPRQLAERLIDPSLASLSAAAWTDCSERKKIGRWTAEAERLVEGGYRDILQGR